MSLYRQPRTARPLLIAGIAVAALLVGGAIGFALGRGSAPDPSAQDVVARLSDELRPLAAGLELLPTEYPQALTGGAESAAVTGDLDRIRSALRDAGPDLQALDPAGLRGLAARVVLLEQAIRARGASREVARLARAAQDALADVPGGR